MTLLVRRFLADYARTPANLLMLAVIPVVFVIVARGGALVRHAAAAVRTMVMVMVVVMVTGVGRKSEVERE